MSDVTTKRLRWRQGSKAAANSTNEVLRIGEAFYETDTKDFKIGDGSTKYRKLLGIKSEAKIVEQLAKGVYRGTNLEEKFADEIAGYSSVADWLHARCAANDFTGIYPFDYFYDTTVAQTVDGTAVAAGQKRKCVIAGIDMYYNNGDTAMPHHITVFAGFSTANVLYNPTNNNNGSSYNANPFLASKLNAVLNGVNNSTSNKVGAVGFDGTGGCYKNTFSSALRSRMVEQRCFLPERYNSASVLTDSTGWSWQGRGLLFAPSEIEAYGCLIHANKPTQTQQNPDGFGPYAHWDIFKSAAGRLLFGRTGFWLASVAGGGSTGACNVSGGGFADCAHTTNTYVRAPLCFHIT